MMKITLCNDFMSAPSSLKWIGEMLFYFFCFCFLFVCAVTVSSAGAAPIALKFCTWLPASRVSRSSSSYTPTGYVEWHVSWRNVSMQSGVSNTNAECVTSRLWRLHWANFLTVNQHRIIDINWVPLSLCRFKHISLTKTSGDSMGDQVPQPPLQNSGPQWP